MFLDKKIENNVCSKIQANARLNKTSSRLSTAFFGLGVSVLSVMLASCGGGSSSGISSNSSSHNSSTLSAQAALGENIFNDASLSASGQMSCATCHIKSVAYAQNNSLPAQLGGTMLNLQGGRTTPSIRYLSFNSAFYFAKDGTPTGGFFWDGRAQSLMDQAGGPFLNPVEMANSSPQDVVNKLAKAPYANEFKQLFGADIFNNPTQAFNGITLALQQYQIEDADFHPFNSKYDAFLKGQEALSAQELRGLALFNNPQKGNCAACHSSSKLNDGTHPLFTDFTYDALGVPRNSHLSQNNNASFYDLGLCARNNNDLLNRTDLCGAFKVPSLRNVALRQAFFHNGLFTNLRDVVEFYAKRDTNPEKYYPALQSGGFDKFNDLPFAYRKNVNTTEAPYNRKQGDNPALSDAEIDDVVAFLKTLSDRT